MKALPSQKQPSAGCENALAAADYEFIRRLVYERSRINLGPDKMELVCNRLRKRARALGMTGLQDYIEFLRTPQGSDEVTGLLDAISTNVTDFFREPDHFSFLTQTVLPEWRKRSEDPGCFRIWSAACSSGEEPYSIAMTLMEFFGPQPERRWEVTASDISTEMLARAERGVYAAERVKVPDHDFLRRYFQIGVGRFEGYYRVKAALRQRIQFCRVNLFDSPYPFRERFDAIFCRNVMIYFDNPTREQLLSQLKGRLVRGGYLFVGHSESLVGIDSELKCMRPSIYRQVPG